MSEPTFKTSESHLEFLKSAEDELKQLLPQLQIVLGKIEAARKWQERRTNLIEYYEQELAQLALEGREQLAASQARCRELESKETALKKSNANLQATLAAREDIIKEIEQVRDEYHQQWSDALDSEERCKAQRDAAVQDAERLREALAALHAVQNGSPLPSYDKDWNTAMQLTERTLKAQHASGSSGGSENHGARS